MAGMMKRASYLARAALRRYSQKMTWLGLGLGLGVRVGVRGRGWG
jgi:hypothetical protein